MIEENKKGIYRANLKILGSNWSSNWVIHVEKPNQAKNVIEKLNRLGIKIPHTNSSILELGDPYKWPPFIKLLKYRKLKKGTMEETLFKIKHSGDIDNLKVCINPITARWAEATEWVKGYGKELKSYDEFLKIFNNIH